ncbi:MAG: hypothetical protein ACJASR_000106 [Psychroserpens sp.]|jgi:hypothetical protein
MKKILIGIPTRDRYDDLEALIQSIEKSHNELNLGNNYSICVSDNSVNSKDFETNEFNISFDLIKQSGKLTMSENWNSLIEYSILNKYDFLILIPDDDFFQINALLHYDRILSGFDEEIMLMSVGNSATFKDLKPLNYYLDKITTIAPGNFALKYATEPKLSSRFNSPGMIVVVDKFKESKVRYRKSYSLDKIMFLECNKSYKIAFLEVNLVKVTTHADQFRNFTNFEQQLKDFHLMSGFIPEKNTFKLFKRKRYKYLSEIMTWKSYLALIFKTREGLLELIFNLMVYLKFKLR